MNLTDLDYPYPKSLIATEPQTQFRTLLSSKDQVGELSQQEIFELFRPGDALVINDTRVLKRRTFTESGIEVLFLNQLEGNKWEVLFPARKLKLGQTLCLPGGVTMTLEKKGLPQTVSVNRPIDEAYFEEHAELALPPYIQAARDSRHNIKSDDHWYQTAWAKHKGSFAAPTASLHFSNDDLEQLKKRGVLVLPITLHVGLGTFLPIKASDLSDHIMHSEWCSIPANTVLELNKVTHGKHRVFALGTTVARALESWAHGYLKSSDSGDICGETDVFIQPGFEFKCVDVLMTNFHQPQSTLLALVAAFSGLDTVTAAYKWAIDKGFKLFSYGDFSIWRRG